MNNETILNSNIKKKTVFPLKNEESEILKKNLIDSSITKRVLEETRKVT